MTSSWMILLGLTLLAALSPASASSTEPAATETTTTAQLDTGTTTTAPPNTGTTTTAPPNTATTTASAESTTTGNWTDEASTKSSGPTTHSSLTVLTVTSFLALSAVKYWLLQ